LVGIADPDRKNRKTFLGLNSLVGLVKEHDCYKEVLSENAGLDGAIITTPNHPHVEPAIDCFKRELAVALEKPIAEHPQACKEMLDAKRKYDGRVIVGFVLRSAPFYKKANQWLNEGRLGEIVSIQADEIPHVLTTSVIFRSDRKRFKKISGGAMNEKCSHDVDLLNWLTGSDPVRLFSIVGRKTLLPREDLPMKCSDCPITSECAYFLPPSKYDHPDMVKTANDG